MTITGLSQNRYLTNNPIWVEVTGAGTKVALSFTSLPVHVTIESYFFVFYTFQGRVIFDLSEIIKPLLPEPNHPQNPISGTIITSNSVTLGMVINSGLNSNFITKTFFRGGEDSMKTNLTLSSNEVLKESTLIPVWAGYPSAKYMLDNDNKVVFSNILSNSEIDRRKVVVCNPVFLRFLNTKGGYSFWLFEEWEITKKASKTERIARRNNPLDLGLITTHELSLLSRVEEDYNDTLSALLQSPEVWCYNIDNILNSSSSDIWTRIYNNGGSIKWNAFEQMNEFSFSFDLLFEHNPQLKW